MEHEEVYYIGDSVPISFEAHMQGQKNQNLTPQHATVSVYNDAGEIIRNDDCSITGNLVEYTLGTAWTKRSGDYVAIFEVNFGFGEQFRKANALRFTVLPRGIDPKMEATPVSNLSEDAGEHEVDTAVNQSMRSARRMMPNEDAKKAAYESAEVKTKRRLKK